MSCRARGAACYKSVLRCLGSVRRRVLRTLLPAVCAFFAGFCCTAGTTTSFSFLLLLSFALPRGTVLLLLWLLLWLLFWLLLFGLLSFLGPRGPAVFWLHEVDHRVSEDRVGLLYLRVCLLVHVVSGSAGH